MDFKSFESHLRKGLKRTCLFVALSGTPFLLHASAPQKGTGVKSPPACAFRVAAFIVIAFGARGFAQKRIVVFWKKTNFIGQISSGKRIFAFTTAVFMFLEPIFRGQRSGWIEVVCGSMFSGKTEELIRRLRRASFARQTVAVFKPSTDTRYHEQNVVSHDDTAFNAVAVKNASEILDLVGEVLVVGIDEAQFFDASLVQVCETLAQNGHRVIVAGLDMDFSGRPFGPMPNLLAVAEYVTKVHAICVHCGSLATHSYRTSPEQTQVLLGEKDSYEPRCRTCYHMGPMLDLR